MVSVAFNDLTTHRAVVLLLQACSDFAGRPLMHSMDVMTEGSEDILFATYSPARKLHRKIALQAVGQYMRGPLLEKAFYLFIYFILLFIYLDEKDEINVSMALSVFPHQKSVKILPKLVVVW